MAGRAKCEEVMWGWGGEREYRSGMKGSCLSERKKKRMKKCVGKKKRKKEGQNRGN